MTAKTLCLGEPPLDHGGVLRAAISCALLHEPAHMFTLDGNNVATDSAVCWQRGGISRWILLRRRGG